MKRQPNERNARALFGAIFGTFPNENAARQCVSGRFICYTSHQVAPDFRVTVKRECALIRKRLSKRKLLQCVAWTLRAEAIPCLSSTGEVSC